MNNDQNNDNNNSPHSDIDDQQEVGVKPFHAASAVNFNGLSKDLHLRSSSLRWINLVVLRST